MTIDLAALTPSDIAAVVGAVAALISAVAALISHLRAKNYKAAWTTAESVGSSLMTTIDKLKNLTADTEVETQRKGIMKDLGVDLGDLKSSVDSKVKSLGLDSGR